jgi:hypothetical protein
MTTRFFTNTNENTLVNNLKGVFSSNKDIECFDALVGFLRASGYFSIRPLLEDVPKIRILVGINVDALIANYHRQGLLFLPDSRQTVEEFKKAIHKDIQEANYKKIVEEGIIQFVEDIASIKIELKAHPSKRLHVKIYTFRPEGFNEHKPGVVITDFLKFGYHA